MHHQWQQDSSIQIGVNTEISPFAVIEPNVCIGDFVTIGHYAVIKEGTKIGNYVHIGDLSVLGKKPAANRKMARKPDLALHPLIVCDHVKIGCNTVIYKGVVLAAGVLVGDLASIRERVTVGEDSIIGRGVIVEPYTTIGNRVTIQTSSYITSDMVIEDQAFIGPCCSTSNDKYMGMGHGNHQGPQIRKNAKIGNNATLLPGVIIGEDAVVGAGAVITRDVPPKEIVIGNPGRRLK